MLVLHLIKREFADEIQIQPDPDSNSKSESDSDPGFGSSLSGEHVLRVLQLSS